MLNIFVEPVQSRYIVPTFYLALRLTIPTTT